MTGCSFNGKNSIDTNVSDARLIFTDTGIDVRNHQNRVYHIVKDMNYNLYYCSDVSGELELVLDKDGNPEKDLNVFK